MAFPGKVMADSETQKLERKDFFQRIVAKVDGGGISGRMITPFKLFKCSVCLPKPHETLRVTSKLLL